MGSDAADWERLRAERKSVLDQVAGRYTRLVAQVGTQDRRKLEAHLQAVREIERGLDARPSQAAACRRPDEPADMDFRSNEMYPAAGKLQMDMLAMALACDLSRVISLQWNKATSSIRHTWVGVDEEHHELSHSGDKNAEAQAKLARITTWYARQYAYLLQKLKSIPEGDGTVLDNTLVLWTGEIAKGNSHSPIDKPYLLGGRAGGALRTGRWLDYGKDGGVYYRGGKQLLSNGGEPVAHNDLLVSILNAMGVDKQTFGNPLYCKGPLRGLL
jgi:hypothetical protein